MTAHLTVPFHEHRLVILDHNGEPYVAMRQIVEAMGLDWKTQYRKLDVSGRWGVVIMTMPSPGGTQRTVCLPLRKLFGWLMTIHPNRVSPDLREKILAFQNECDDVLWAYWNGRQAQASNQEAPAAMPPEQVAAIRERLQRVASIFHPFSQQFDDLLGVQRSLGGCDPRLGIPNQGWIKQM